MTTKIGLSGSEITTSDPDVESYDVTITHIGASQRALDGTLRRQIVATKRRWVVTWRGQSGTSRSDLLTELMRQANLMWYPPDGGGPHTVQVNEFKQKFYSGSAVVADISATLEQV